ncbi:hypothetical protein CsSME_00029170 [Camellia sinensis var. sinensis]
MRKLDLKASFLPFSLSSIAYRRSSRSHTVALLHTGPASGNHPHQHQAKLLSDAGGGKGEPLNKIRRLEMVENRSGRI